MAILINRDSKIIVQGITGKNGLFHAMQCRDYGSQVLAGVTPGKGGTVVEGFPVFDTVAEAVVATGANVSLIFVPPPGRPTRSLRLRTLESNWRSVLLKGYRCVIWSP